MDGMDAGCHLEIVPRRGEMIFFKKGARKGLDNTTATQSRGGENKSRGSERPPPK